MLGRPGAPTRHGGDDGSVGWFEMAVTSNSTRERAAQRFGLSAGVALAALLVGVPGLSAQESTTLDEISVAAAQPTAGTRGIVATRSTAGMKGNDSILETPANVSVVTREELNVRGVQKIEEALGYTPGYLSEDYSGGQGAAAFTIRGFRTINFENVYEDGLRYGFNTYDQNIEPYAYERIDVIKGPQSALYGAGQPGGVVNLISKRPQFTPYNEVFLMGGSFNRVQGGFDLTGPVEGHPEFAYRFTGLVRQSDTQVAYSPDDRVYISPAVTWRPDADTSLTVMAKYANYHRGGSEQVLPFLGSVIPVPNKGFFKRDLFIGSPNYNMELLNNGSVSYVLDHSFAPNWLFHSALRYTETASDFKLTGYQPDPFVGTPFQLPAGQFYTYPYNRFQTSHALVAENHVEGRFETGFIEHNIVAGVDFQNYVRRNKQFLSSFPGTPFDPFNPTNLLVVDSSAFPDYLYTRQLAQQTGVYFQDQMKFGGFILTGSVRHDWYSSSLLTDSSYVPVLNPGVAEKQDIKALSYRGAIGYDFGNGLVPFVAYSTSFNPQISGFSIVNGGARPLDPNEGRQIEGGLKYQPPGTNALYTASGFEIKQTNVPYADFRFPGAFIQTGETTVTGFELEGKHSFDNGLSIIAGFTHLEAKVTKDTTINPILGTSLVGKTAPNVPKNAFSLFVDYVFPVSSAFAGLRAGAGVRYVGERTDIYNFDQLPGYALVDASISYDLAYLDPSLKGFTASAYGNNLFDKRYFTAAFYPGSVPSSGVATGTVFEGFRRTVYGQLTYRW